MGLKPMNYNLHKKVKYEAELQMNLMNGFLIFWLMEAQGQNMYITE